MQCISILFVVITLIFSPAFADSTSAAGACYSIQDNDARAACLAKAHNDPGRCYSVQSADKRAQCLAELRK